METTVFTPDFSYLLFASPMMDELAVAPTLASPFPALEAAKTPLADDEEDEDDDEEDDDEDEDEDDEDLEDDDLDEDEEDDDLEDDEDEDDDDDEEEDDDVEDDDPKPLRVKTRT